MDTVTAAKAWDMPKWARMTPRLFSKRGHLRGILAYGMAVVVIAIATAIRWWMDPVVGEHAAYATYFAAICAMAALTEVGPTLLTILLGYVLSDWFFIEPRYTLGISGAREWIDAGVYWGVSICLVVAIQTMRSAKRRAQSAARIAVERQTELERVVAEQAQTSAELQKAKEYAEHLIEAANILVIGLDASGVVQVFNEAAEKLTGYSSREVLGRNWFESIAPKEKYKAVWERFRDLDGPGLPLTCVNPIVMKSGEERLISWRNTFQHEGGRVVRMISFGVDITESRKIEQELRETKERFEAAVAGARDGIWDRDLRNNKVFFSDHWKTMLGYGVDELADHVEEFNRLVHPEDRKRLKEMLEAHLRGETPFYSCEFRMRQKDGNWRWIQSRGTALRDAEGKAYRIAGSHTDITERKMAEMELRESRENLQIAVLAGQMGTWSWDLQKKTLSWSPQSALLLGYAADEEPNLKAWHQRVLPEDLKQTEAALVTTIRSGSDFQCNYRVRWPNETIHWLRMQGRCFYTERGEPIRLNGVIFDITAEKEVETELRWQVDERTASLKQNLEAWQNFLFHVAHDLRAPLRTIKGFSEMLLEMPSVSESASTKDFMLRIADAGKKMDQLIIDLLNYGRMGYQAISCGRVNLSLLVGLVLTELEPEVQDKKAEIEIGGPMPEVWADEHALEQVIINLLTNGLKYVAPGVAPRIRIWAERGAGMVRLYVQDNGIGIAPEDTEKIWGVFERLHDNKTYPGTGIGLPIVKKGMERMGGKVGVESEKGKGSRFWVEMRAPGGKQ